MSQQTAPLPQPTPRDPTITLYCNRLQSLLHCANQTAITLIPTPSEAAAAAEKGPKATVAIDLQGRSALAVHETVAHHASNIEWSSVWQSAGLGSLVEYGVPSNLAPWAVSELHPPQNPSIPLSENDPRVQTFRICVWESEPACLPVALMERLVNIRRVMRRFKQRIDLCTKILCALQGRGRKLTQAALDKLKLALEKADLQAEQEERKRLAAEALRQERAEKAALAARARQEKAQEKEMKASVLRKREKQEIKRKRQATAQASFMKRFVKQKAVKTPPADDLIDLTESTNNSTDLLSGVEIHQVQSQTPQQEPGLLPTAPVKDVMPVAWWLLSEMEGLDLEDFEAVLKPPTSNLPALTSRNLREHLKSCAVKRRAAEQRLSAALSLFRQKRTIHTDDRTPYFAKRRASVRGFSSSTPMKLIQFSENFRPAFFGILSRRSGKVCGRRPFAKDRELDYEFDSADEWEGDDDDAEDLCDVEGQEERAKEDAELLMLYGSDEEDDDDFLDDGDAEDDGEEEDEEEGDAVTRTDECAVGKNSGLSQDPKAPSSGTVDCIQPDDLTLSPASLSKKKVQSMRGNNGAKDTKNRKRKRRHGGLKQHVTIHGVSIPEEGETSQLDEYMVSLFDGALIEMFDPTANLNLDSKLPTESPRSTVPRSRVLMDETARLELAVALNGTGSRDKIVHQFCESRRLRGLAVPPKTEVIRAIGEIATREKRGTDTRAGWYLNDQSLALKLRDLSQLKPDSSNVPMQSFPPPPCTPTVAE